MLSLNSTPSEHLSLSELVYRSLHAAIINGVYKPGEMLRQEELAQNLGVSRAPIREALPKLVADGVVEQIPRRGYVVVSLNAEEIEEIFELRLLIEGHIVAIAAQQRKKQDILQAEKILAEMEGLNVKNKEQRMRWFVLNSQFHKILLLPSGRKHFIRAVYNLRTVVEPYIRVETGLTGNVEQANQEHREILDAFRLQDAEKMNFLLKTHIENTTARLLSGLQRKR